MRSKTSRGEGLVPRWGGGGAWQNPRCQFTVTSHNSGPSIRHSREGGNPRTMTARQYVDRKTGSSCHDQCSAGACPQPPAGPPYLPRRMAGVPPHTNLPVGAIRESPWDGARQNPPCQFAVASDNSSFSYLGVPAPAGMSDCYENRLPAPRIRHSREGGNPRTNIPRTNANRDTTTCVHTASPTLGPPKTNATAGTIRESP